MPHETVARAGWAVPGRDGRGGVPADESAVAGVQRRVRRCRQRRGAAHPASRFVHRHAWDMERPGVEGGDNRVTIAPAKTVEVRHCRGRGAQALAATAVSGRGAHGGAAGRLAMQVSNGRWPRQQVHRAAWPVRRSAWRKASRDVGCAPSPCSSKVRARPPQATRGSARTAGAVARGYSGRRSIWAASGVGSGHDAALGASHIMRRASGPLGYWRDGHTRTAWMSAFLIRNTVSGISRRRTWTVSS